MWLSSLAEARCFRCAAIYLVLLLRLASERRLALLPQTAAQEGEEKGGGLSFFSVVLLSHLSLTPQCNEGKTLHAEFLPFGVDAPENSCWGCCCPKHPAAFCAEAVTRWAVQGLMRFCVLRPEVAPVLFKRLKAEGRWRVLGAAVYGGREVTQEDAIKPPFPEGMGADVNKCRKQLLRFLKGSCLLLEESETLSLEDQLAHLKSFCFSEKNSYKGKNAETHANPAKLFFPVYAAQIPGAAKPASGIVALAERSTCLSIVKTLTTHLQLLMHKNNLMTGQYYEILTMADGTVYGSLHDLVSHLEHASRQLKNNHYAGRSYKDTYFNECGAAAAYILATMEPLGRLLRLAAAALGGPGGPARCTLSSSAFLCKNKRKEGERNGGKRAEVVQRWGEVGATVCLHVANICQAFFCKGVEGSVTHMELQLVAPWLRLLRRALGFFAALVQTEEAFSSDESFLVNMTGCMRRLGVHADFNLELTERENLEENQLGEEKHQQHAELLRRMMLCLLQHFVQATEQLRAAGEGERLLLMACESLVFPSSKSLSVSENGSSLLLHHLKWLLPLFTSNGNSFLNGLTAAEGARALALLVQVCNAYPAETNLVETAALVRQLQTIATADALRLHNLLLCLLGGPLGGPPGSPLKGPQVGAANFFALGQEVTNRLRLKAAERVLLCLCFELCPSAANAARGAEAREAEEKNDVIVFRAGLVDALRWCWDQYRSLRYTCTRLFVQENSKPSGNVSLHPAVRLALLLHWRDTIQALPVSFYPSLEAALQQCNETRVSFQCPAHTDGSATQKRRKGPPPQQLLGEDETSSSWASEILHALKLTAYARDGTGPSGKRMRAKAAPWQLASAFFTPGNICKGPRKLTAEMPGLWAEATRSFLHNLCMQQPGGAVDALLGLRLARELENAAGGLAEPFMISEGYVLKALALSPSLAQQLFD